MQHESTILTPEFYKQLNAGNIVIEDDERSLGSFQQLSVIHRALHPKERKRARTGNRSRTSLSSGDSHSHGIDDHVNPVEGNASNDFACKLCAVGFTVRCKGEEKSLTPQELKWISMIADYTEHHPACNVDGMLNAFTQYYNEFVCPALNCEKVARHDIEMHLKRCTYNPLLEEMFQVHQYRRLADRYGDLEAKHLENGETSRQTADMHIKYNNLTMKLLQDREKTIRQKRNAKD